jgi:uncharacterized protein (UPF0218 family)
MEAAPVASAPKKPTIRRKTDSKKDIVQALQTQVPVSSSKPASSIQSVDDWVKFRVKNPAKYGFTPQGDLLGADQSVVEMIPKVSADPAVIQQRLDERFAKIKEAEEAFTQARRQLHEITNQYRAGIATVGDVVAANQAVHVADCAIALVAKYPRRLDLDKEYIFRDLHLDDFYNVRKFPDAVIDVEYTSFPQSLFWSDRSQEKITLETLAEEDATKQAEEAQAKKNAARTGAIIGANRAKANFMAGR